MGPALQPGYRHLQRLHQARERSASGPRGRALIVGRYSALPVTPGHDDLFSRIEVSRVDDKVLRFFSGAGSARAIFNGYAQAGAPMCLIASGLGSPMLDRACRYAARGGRLMLDSGAFIHRADPSRMDWDRVLQVYQAVTDVATASVTLILPDAVGDQALSLQLLRQYGAAMGTLGRGMHELMLPMQSGRLPAPAFLNAAIQAVGFKPDGLALPSVVEAFPLEELVPLLAASTTAHRLHFLGISRRSKALATRLHLARLVWPDAVFSVDAAEHRAHVGKQRSITLEREQALTRFSDGHMEDWDDTEDDQVDEAARAEMRTMFPNLTDEGIDDLMCQSWGQIACTGIKRDALRAELGADSTTVAIRAFAERRRGSGFIPPRGAPPATSR